MDDNESNERKYIEAVLESSNKAPLTLPEIIGSVYQLTKFLDKDSIMNLTVTDKTIFRRIKSYVTNTFAFKPDRLPQIYAPNKILYLKLISDNRDAYSCLSRYLKVPDPSVKHGNRWKYFTSVKSIDIDEGGSLVIGNSDQFSPSITTLSINWLFKINRLPAFLTTLIFKRLFDQPVDILPRDSSLTVIIFGRCFDHPVDELPAAVTKLVFGRNFNQPVDYLPVSLEYLEFGSHFNQSVDSLPNSVIVLKFGKKFNNPVDYLPSQLESVEFGSNFDQPIDYLPSKVITLTLGDKFNQTCDHLPPTIKYITFGESFNQNVDHLPPNVATIIFGNRFNKTVDRLPESVVNIHFK